ncbi:MAG: extracellular solute-binding protein [Chloroflexi bacterium]|nr:extracellular solute-binding protein [Chloroflexota bacterium]
MSDQPISRREFLRLSATLAAGSVLAACAPAATPVPTAAPTKAAAMSATAVPATTAAAMACSKGDICIKPTSVKLPKGAVTFRLLDSGDVKGVYWKKFFELYQKSYPNITCQYDGLGWNEIAKIVPLGVQNGNAHDCFSIPLGISPAQAIQEGWIRPLDDLIPDLDKVKAAFPPMSFVEGINMFGGKTYTFPLGTNQRSNTMLLFNQEQMQKAGYDPIGKPFTWDDFRAAAKKITEQGAGKYFGIIDGGAQLPRWGFLIGDLMRLNGGVSYVNATGAEGFLDLRKGEYIFTNDNYIGAIELLLAMKADGSFFPGFMSLNALQARANMGQGNAGMMLQGLWCIDTWRAENPNFKYAVALTPTQKGGGTYSPLHASAGGNVEWWLYAKSKVPEIVADIFCLRGTLEGQYAWNKIAGLGNPGIFPQAIETASDIPSDLKSLEMQFKMFRVGPTLAVRNPDIVKVDLERKAPTPSVEQVIQGLMSGQITGVKQAMQGVKDAYDKELDRALKAAKDKGANVSRDDYVFPNWDLTKDYTEADYKAIKK